LVFNEDFVDLSGIDMADARTPGFNFYRKQWFGGGPTPVDSIIQQSTSIVRIGQRPGTDYYANRGRIQTASNTSEGSYFGNAWGGGAYFEIRMKWSQDVVSGAPQFGIYLFLVEHLEDLDNSSEAKWIGAPTNYGHFGELDIFEFAGSDGDGTYTTKTRYQTTLHDWAGTSSNNYSEGHFYNSNTPIDLGFTPDWTQLHTYGAWWTPQADADTPGSMKFYFDGTHIEGADVYWLNSNWPNPVAWPGSWPTTPQDRSSPELADDLFAIIDSGHLALSLDGSTECGMDVDFVRVWQYL
jgi:hypothetical protein